jgi:hypothetical protein
MSLGPSLSAVRGEEGGRRGREKTPWTIGPVRN